jgi:C1A family cysteine protease
LKNIRMIKTTVALGLMLLILMAPLGGHNKTVLKFSKGDNLEELRFKIKQNGYDFKVSHNWVFDMSPEQKEIFFSRKPSIIRRQPETNDPGPLRTHLGEKTLPPKFDWRSHNGHSYIGAVRNQGYCGSCYAFGAAAAAEGTYNVAMERYDSDSIDFSESFIMWCLGSLPQYNSHFYDYDYRELQALVEYGIILESDFPYTTSTGNCTHWDKPAVKFSKWYRIPCGDIDAIKTAIMTYGVVDAAVMTTSAFEAYSSGVYQDSNTACFVNPCYYTPTDHAISLVGWDDMAGAFILRNSWGPSWGENGYMRIKYNSAVVACEVCYLVIDNIVLQLGVSREDLDIWVFNQQYADIELRVDKTASVQVSKYIIYRKESAGPYQPIMEISEAQLDSGVFTMIDKNLEASKTYSYKAVAMDSGGYILGSSGEITI